MPQIAQESTSGAVTRLAGDHGAAVREFVTLASSLPADRWDRPRAPGKWTPAQETKHLTLGYAAFVRDLNGEGTLRLRGRRWQRLLWRWRILPRILSTGRLLAAPAPREVRPPDHPGERPSLLAELQDTVATFEVRVLETSRSAPRRRVTHPYFNGLSLEQLLRLSAAHVRHHAAFLRESLSR